LLMSLLLLDLGRCLFLSSDLRRLFEEPLDLDASRLLLPLLLPLPFPLPLLGWRKTLSSFLSFRSEPELLLLLSSFDPLDLLSLLLLLSPKDRLLRVRLFLLLLLLLVS